jgi:acyl carrier protein
MATRTGFPLMGMLLLVAAALAVFWSFGPAPTFVGSAAMVQSRLRASVLPRAATLQKASEDTMAKLVEIIAEYLVIPKARVVGEARLFDLGADSLDILEAVMALEEAFDVELPNHETTPLKNLQELGDLIHTKLLATYSHRNFAFDAGASSAEDLILSRS